MSRKKKTVSQLPESIKKKPIFVSTSKVKLVAKNEEQKIVLREISRNSITFISGIAGVGKTYLSTIYGFVQLQQGNCDKLIFIRPCIEAYGEKIGYLPGDVDEKIAPYMMPIFDILSSVVGIKQVNRMIEEKKILTLSLAFLRGMTFDRSFVLLDEGQNATKNQIRLFLTRIGRDSKLIVAGDLSQSDLGSDNGFVDAVVRLQGVEGISFIELSGESMIRNPIITEIEKRYSETLD